MRQGDPLVTGPDEPDGLDELVRGKGQLSTRPPRLPPWREEWRQAVPEFQELKVEPWGNFVGLGCLTVAAGMCFLLVFLAGVLVGRLT